MPKRWRWSRRIGSLWWWVLNELDTLGNVALEVGNSLLNKLLLVCVDLAEDVVRLGGTIRLELC